MILLDQKAPVLIRVFYYMPDHRNLVQEFSWQTLDVPPTYPRRRCNIEAVIADVEMSIL
jgi:uncharacterized protein Usg